MTRRLGDGVLVQLSAALILASGVVWPAVAAGVSPDAAQTALAQARAALSAGRLDEAVKLADGLLSATPSNREAVDVKIRALTTGGKSDLALRAYDAYAASAKRQDAGLLTPLAEGALQILGAPTQTETRLRAEALERLARHGRASARSDLEKMALSASDASLARLGDVKAALRLAELAASPAVQNKVPIIENLRAAKAVKQAYVLVPLLDDTNPLVQVAAAQALGALGHREALPQLRGLLEARVPYVRMSAAVAIARLGDRSADAQITSLLKSDSPDVRLLAVEALADGKDRGWTSVAKALLADPNGLTRLRAAELLLTAEPDAARPVLAKAASDANPVVRQEAVRVLETRAPYDVRLLRSLLADSSAWVRLHAAGALLAAAGAGTSG